MQGQYLYLHLLLLLYFSFIKLIYFLCVSSISSNVFPFVSTSNLQMMKNSKQVTPYNQLFQVVPIPSLNTGKE